MTGWSLTEIEEAPAVTLDWLLAIDDKVEEVRAKLNRANTAPPGGGWRQE